MLLTKYWELHRHAINKFINDKETIELEFEYAAIEKRSTKRKSNQFHN